MTKMCVMQKFVNICAYIYLNHVLIYEYSFIEVFKYSVNTEILGIVLNIGQDNKFILMS